MLKFSAPPSGAPALPKLTPLKALLPLVIASVCLWLLLNKLQTLDLTLLQSALSSISPVAWALAALATVASFWAVGRYDTVLHRHFDTGVPTPLTVQSGVAAIALSQTLGFGLVIGSLVRLQRLPALGVQRAVAITVLCALSFGAALATLIALCSLLTQGRAAAPWALPLLGALLVLPLASLLWPRLRLPSLPAMGALLLLTCLDTLFAALAFMFLLPDLSGINLLAFYAAFLTAFGAGLLSGAPAGAGAFELSLLALLPALPEAELVAGLIGFRLIYYALPALFAACLLLKKPPAAPPAERALHRATPPTIAPRLLAHARRAELGVTRQNGATLLTHGDAALCAIATPQTLTALFDPAHGSFDTLLPALVARARLGNRVPAVYKCSQTSATALRRAGFVLLHIANEARIDVKRFDTAAPAHRQLRRKLRKAASAGVTVRCSARLPLAEMHRVDAAWSARHKAARGFSMGRFCPDYLAKQRVYLAYHKGALVAFVSFHLSAHELCLDLMRSTDDAPDGTMHSLITQAIHEAAATGRQSLSLAALPALHHAGPLAALLSRLSGAAGLGQFKACFAPRLAPLYMAAPSRLGLGLALLDLTLSIHRPGFKPNS
ncbi:phosphatidylglycerol lysyltransferase domain-containing protein [Lentibacter sp.]|mgnify:CR=1 FL=1|uniref:phosphatidylglycerol lysyltransferase domain-containing protein n=1 Tax=Lentibacter sp. TaxID=2024994 RepID=UPI003F69D4E8